MWFRGLNPDGLDDLYLVKNIVAFRTQPRGSRERLVKVKESGEKIWLRVGEEEIERLVQANSFSMVQHARLLRAGYRPMKKRRAKRDELLIWLSR